MYIRGTRFRLVDLLELLAADGFQVSIILPSRIAAVEDSPCYSNSLSR